MKNFSLFILLCNFLSCCTIREKSKIHYLSTLENVKFIVSKKDSIRIDSVKTSLKRTQEKFDKAKNDGWICFEPYDKAEYIKGGVDAFRKSIFEKFKVSKNAKEGENLIRFTIGKKNNLEEVEILKYSDKKSKMQIENIFRLKEFDHWSSARIEHIPVKQQFEISIFIRKNNN